MYGNLENLGAMKTNLALKLIIGIKCHVDAHREIILNPNKLNVILLLKTINLIAQYVPQLRLRNSKDLVHVVAIPPIR
jgi:hypothetical protein